MAVEAAHSVNLGLRDTAMRAMGKFIESFPPAQLSLTLRPQLFKCLNSNLGDDNSSVGFKAMRSLRKMGRYGHLTGSEREQIHTICRRILCIDEHGEWDRAYVVRKEAEEAITHLQYSQLRAQSL
jgi:hypothetical protein